MCAVLIWLNPVFVITVIIILSAIIWSIFKLINYPRKFTYIVIISAVVVLTMIISDNPLLYVIANMLIPRCH